VGVSPTSASVKPPQPQRLTCAQGTDGHHACQHFEAIYRYAKDLMVDCAFCPVCGVDAEGDDDIVHMHGCALIVLVNAEDAKG